MSIIDSWLERAIEKYGSRKEGIAKLNQVCNMRLREAEFSAMKTGKRGVNECIYFLMLNDVLLTELEKAGFDISISMTNDQYVELIEALTPPQKR